MFTSLYTKLKQSAVDLSQRCSPHQDTKVGFLTLDTSNADIVFVPKAVSRLMTSLSELDLQSAVTPIALER